MAFNQQNPLIPLSSLHCTFNPLFLNFFQCIQSYNNGEFFTLLCNLNCSKEEQRKQEVAETNEEKQTTTLIYPGVGFNLLGQHSAERNQEATVYVGNLDPQLLEDFFWELLVQACPILSINVYVPKDRMTNLHQGYGFIEFLSEEDAYYVRSWYRMGSRQSSMMGSSQVIRDSSIHVLPFVLIVSLGLSRASHRVSEKKGSSIFAPNVVVATSINQKSLVVILLLPLTMATIMRL
ncbi:hypothetical protein Bca4012_101306 [Brassica carinata]|uniref:BnaCnng34150D protein n=2 Tax=Brassica TaxID=3705 RepID=A0A078J4U6_BRANA|nr:BnaCnng34150D [Brassica napus]VDD63812.1 unnamed protein product [Brassica oleracea]